MDKSIIVYDNMQ